VCSPIAGAVISGVGSIYGAMEQRKAVAAENRANQIATNNRNTIKIAKHNEDKANQSKIQDANKASVMAAIGGQDLQAYQLASELSQRNVNSLMKIMSNAGGMESFGNTASRLRNKSWQIEGKAMSNAAAAFSRGLEQTELKKEALSSQYNANIRTGSPLILESDPIPKRAPSLLPTFLGAAGKTWDAYEASKPPFKVLQEQKPTGPSK
tara:strand:- start:1642 stop:2268 length:627 start_codon:yes stop_codon:yes gene_type:complete